MHTSFFKNSNLVHFAVYCLIKANHKETTFFMNGENVILAPGEFVTGFNIVGKETQLSRQCYRTCLKNLEKCQFLTTKSTNKFTIISIKNWGEYQGEEKANHLTNHGATTGQPPSNHQATTYKNDKNNKNDKKEPYVPIFSENSDEIKLSNLLFEKICKNNPTTKKPNIQSWAKSIDFMIKNDNRTIEDITKIINFSQSDNFWKTNILSTEKLREKYDQLWLKMQEQKTPEKIPMIIDDFPELDDCKKNIVAKANCKGVYFCDYKFTCKYIINGSQSCLEKTAIELIKQEKGL